MDLDRFERGYDLYKYFRLARRIPCLLMEVCPRCGEGLVDGICVNCKEVENLRLVEAWKNLSAAEVEVGPFSKVLESADEIIFATN